MSVMRPAGAPLKQVRSGSNSGAAVSSRFRLRHAAIGVLGFTALTMLWMHHGLLHLAHPPHPLENLQAETAGRLRVARRAREQQAAAVTHDLPPLTSYPRITWPPSLEAAASGLSQEAADAYDIYAAASTSADHSARCHESVICDNHGHGCGESKLGCVTSAEERQAWVQEAMSTSWAAYK
jgi:hypothetical protein